MGFRFHFAPTEIFAGGARRNFRVKIRRNFREKDLLTDTKCMVRLKFSLQTRSVSESLGYVGSDKSEHVLTFPRWRAVFSQFPR